MATITNEQARAVMAAWNLDTGVSPFGDAGGGYSSERSRYVLTQASSMLSMLAAACNDAQTLTGSGQTSEFNQRNANVLGSALDGIGTLVDLANFFAED